MGASSSIDNIPLPRHIHMSYPYTKNKKFIHDKLKEELEKYSLIVSKTDYNDFNLNISNINKCEFVIICLLENSISDSHQIKELSLAETKTKNTLFLIMDENFTPVRNAFIKTIIWNNQWEMCWEIDHLSLVKDWFNDNFAKIY